MTNEVKLAGTISRAPETRVLPSGDALVSFRVLVAREAGKEAREGKRPGSDWVDCAVWSARLRRSVARWELGDQVEVSGALRRRVYRAGGGPVALVEIEVAAARRLRGGDRA
jgi:single-strand DNA-binding protein